MKIVAGFRLAGFRFGSVGFGALDIFKSPGVSNLKPETCEPVT
jgi:hypothetical protein